MKVYTEIVLNMSTGEVISEKSYDYSGPVALCKGEGAANDQRKQELAMQQKAFDAQMAQLGELKKSLSQYMTPEGEGFTPEQTAAMRSNFLNQNAQNYNSAGSNVRSALAARGSAGGDAPVGGDYVRGIAGLEGAAASDRSSGLTNIDLQNFQQALTNKFNAASVLSGNAATLNGTQSASGSAASSALESYIYGKNNGPLGKAFGQFAGGLGQGLGAGVSGGLGKMMSGSSGGNSGGGSNG